ncbi:uncharacterized protein [Aegilops tauschii subsp. strangulata]|uniref:uncharacterized protein n=1 Tax=Aegilops tauschii subsp. strangulata TaxID=200361 RepID=UPI00098A1664|nr:vicilin-like seed storage protein At2g18540 [Aegilops tauschii subsp. strangulata]
MNQVGQRPPPPVPEPRPPPPTGSWIRILRSVASSLGLSLRSLMVLLWRACRLPAGQDEEERNDAKNKNETGGQDDEDRLKKTEIAARKRARQKAKKAARKEAKAKAKKTKKEAKAEDKKKRQEEEAMKRKEEEEAAKEEARIREEEQKAAKEKARQKLAEDKKKADLEEAKRRQREDAERRKEEARMEEEDRQRRREEAQRRKEADRNKDEYEDEKDVHISYWSQNHNKRKKQCLGNIPDEIDRHNNKFHKGVEMRSCRKKGCLVRANKRDIQVHEYYCHGLSK